jgi:hypothetical protein
VDCHNFILYAFSPVNILADSMTYPREEAIRSALLERAQEYTRLTGQSASAIGLVALNDTAFIGKVARGHNFTVGKYQKLHNWFDHHWPE